MEATKLVLLEDNSLITGVVYSIYENGQIDFEWYVRSGLRIGWQREYSENGDLISEINLIDGNGCLIKKFPDGTNYSEENFKNGVRSGYSRWWYPNGKLRSESLFQNGDEINSKCWDEDGKELQCV